MDDAEIMGRVVGMLTVADEARRDPRWSPDDIAALYDPLVDLGKEVVTVLFRPGDAPEVIQAAVRDAVDQRASSMREAFSRLVGAFMVAFQELAIEYEAACPDADVPGFLRRLGIQSAGDDA